jgi:hypothetical protein
MNEAITVAKIDGGIATDCMLDLCQSITRIACFLCLRALQLGLRRSTEGIVRDVFMNSICRNDH